ncbi:MAG: pilus assembly protein PilM [Deltaproteobacteria bacterium]|nr:pilus assembly protein PilM [Deltaproteobacteria bacterium]
MYPLIEVVRKKVQSLIDRKRVAGFDFGRTGVRVVSFERQSDLKEPGLQVFHYPHPVSDTEPVSIESFRLFLKREHLDQSPAACNVDDPSLKIRSFDLPKMPDSDLQEALQWQLRDVTEDSVAKYVIRHTILQDYKVVGGDRLSLMGYAIHREAVERRLRLLAALSLKPRLIEPTPVALLSSLDRLLEWTPGAVYGLLDLGEGHSSFIALSDRKLFFSRPLIEVSGEEMTRLIMQELNISETEALDFRTKLFKNDGSEADERLKAVLPLCYSRIAIETERSLDGFSLLFPQMKQIETIFLAGGGALLPGLREFLAKNVGIQIDLVDPFKGWNVPGADHHLYHVATGLAFYGGSQNQT